MKGSVKQNRKFGLTIGAIFLLIAGWQVFKHHQVYIVATIAVVLLIVALVKPVWLDPLRLVWDKIGHVLGIINTHVLLSLFYFLLLTPYALVLRLVRRDVLNLKKSISKGTYWQTPEDMSMGTMKDQF